MLIVAIPLVFAAIVLLVLGLAWQEESQIDARMAMLRGERPVANFRPVTARESLTSRVIFPLFESWGSGVGQLLPTHWMQAIQRGLVMAGQPVTVTGFLVAALLVEGTLVAFSLMIIASSEIDARSAGLIMAATVGLGAYLPRIWLSNRIRHRQKEILKSLPDAFDLITVCVEAGLGLDAALARVAEKVEGPFGEELAVSLREISLGKLRRDALKELAERTAVPDLSTFINAVVQAETMGTSIAAVLRVQADQMRIRRRQRAEQQAMAAPIKMMFPLVLCIFPSLFIVILGPAGINIYQQLANR